MYQKIIICIDDTPLSEQAVRAGADLACRYDAEIVLLSILDPARLPDQPYTGMEAVQMLDQHSRSLSQNLHRFGALLHDRGIRSRQVQMRGHSAAMILQTAQSEAADLVVVGTHVQGRLRAWLHNDLWSEVSHKAACHVLRVTPKKETKKNGDPVRARTGLTGSRVISLSAL